jgi:hypothetical protein
MPECTCKDYPDVELDRKSLSKRIRETRVLVKNLTPLYKKRGEEYELYKCDVCGQIWQGSRSWTQGNERYLFQVPPISVEEWLDEPYISPDEMMVFSWLCAEREIGISRSIYYVTAPVGRFFPPYKEATEEEKEGFRQIVRDSYSMKGTFPTVLLKSKIKAFFSKLRRNK